MSNRNSPKSQFPAWQARHKNERFVRISRSMKESPAWKSLGKNATQLYLTCMEWTYDAESRPQTVASKKLYPRDEWPDSPNIKDGDFFLKLVIYVILGAVWLRFASPLQIGSFQLNGAPLGMMVGVIVASRDKNTVDRKIAYAVLLVMMILTYFLPAAIVL